MNNSIGVFEELAEAFIDEEFEWNNEFLEVLKIGCPDPTLCEKYRITNMVISLNKGLLSYQLNTGETWQTIE